MNGLHINGQDSVSQPLLTDDYQLNMAYTYWQQGTHIKKARFELFFRKNPFEGEFTVFAGLEDCIRFVQNLHFSQSDLDFIRRIVIPHAEEKFFEYLKHEFDCRNVKLLAVPEGTVVFPRVPLIIVEGPLAVCQFLETPLLNLVNYASLVATNAARFRLAAGDNIELMEFGLRRAQGPNGGLSASKYCYIGGFDSTSNLLAGKLYGIPVKGTMAHSFVTSFKAEEPLRRPLLKCKFDNKMVDLRELAEKKLGALMEMKMIDWGISRQDLNDGELTAFCAYAIAHPDALLALIDTYDTLRIGLPNFCACALALAELGYRPIGVRIDSGDLAYLSRQIRARFQTIARGTGIEWFANLKIVGSNDINEATIISLHNQRHEMNAFGVGTHLVTCQKQPALGCVYKLVDLDGEPKIKLSEEASKVLITGRKKAFRLYGKSERVRPDGQTEVVPIPMIDLLMLEEEPDPEPHSEIMCHHPFERKRARAIPYKVEALHRTYWEDGKIQEHLPNLMQIREQTRSSLLSLREDHLRTLNPTPYKVSLSQQLCDFFDRIRDQNAPIGLLM